MKKAIAVAVLLTAVSVLAGAQECGLEVTYLANAGYMLRAGETKVLVDALFRQAMKPYLNHAPETLAKLEKGQPPFDGVEVVLATHQHADHFDAASVAEFLKNNPKAVFIAWKPVAELALKAGAAPDRVRSSATEERESFEVNGIRVDMLRLSHGQARGGDMNVGYVVHIGGKKVFHPGDAWWEAKNFQRVGLPAEKVDVALIPYWYVEESEPGVAVVKELAAKKVVMIHVPPVDVEELRGLAPKVFSGAVVMEARLNRHCF